MALKQAEEGLDTETVLLVEAPKPASHTTDTAQAQTHTPAKTAVN